MPSLLFVIAHVVPLSGSKPGCEISKPCFLTSLMYLKQIGFKLHIPIYENMHLYSNGN